ncbi:hypothetical protein GW750_06345 [bacterium]|nr:hypothetical protein [bacterium]
MSWSLSSESIPFINHFCASSGDSTLCVATRSSFALLAVISVFGAFVSSGTLSLPSAIHNIVKNPAVASHVFFNRCGTALFCCGTAPFFSKLSFGLTDCLLLPAIMFLYKFKKKTMNQKKILFVLICQ